MKWFIPELCASFCLCLLAKLAGSPVVNQSLTQPCCRVCKQWRDRKGWRNQQGERPGAVGETARERASPFWDTQGTARVGHRPCSEGMGTDWNCANTSTMAAGPVPPPSWGTQSPATAGLPIPWGPVWGLASEASLWEQRHREAPGLHQKVNGDSWGGLKGTKRNMVSPGMHTGAPRLHLKAQ